jgi:pyridoxine 4-dehydrogenase
LPAAAPPTPSRRGALLGAASLAASLAVSSPLAAAAPAASASTTTTIGAVRVSAVGAGTWQFGNQLLWNYDPAQDGELRATFDELLSGPDAVFTDTADSYGTGKLEGRAETLLGEFAAASPRGDRAFIATKLAPYPSRLTPAAFVDAAQSSLRRLQRPRVDVVQAHWSVSNYAPWQEGALLDGLADIYDAGLAGGVGLSNYGPKQLRLAHAKLAARGVPLVSAQVQYSLLSLEPERSGLREACDELGVRLIAYSPLCLGALTGKYEAGGALPSGPRGLLLGSLLKDAGPLLGLLREVAAAHAATPAQVAVNWCRAKGALPIPGSRTVAQARDERACLTWSLDAAEVAELDRAAARCKGTVQNSFQTA